MSYVLVTLTAALAMSLATAIVQATTGQLPGGRPGAADVVEKSAARSSAFLVTARPGPDALSVSVAQPTMTELARDFGGRARAVAVLSPGGAVLAATACPPRQATTDSPSACRNAAAAVLAPLIGDPKAMSTIRSLTTGPGPHSVARGTVGGRGYVAATIPGADKLVAGALVAVFAGAPPLAQEPSTFTAVLSQWRSTISPTWLPLLAAVLVLGTLAGLLLSGKLVRRIHGIAATVRVWSRGDLDHVARTAGHDELADLATDLNHMAEQLRNLLAARSDLAKAQERSLVRRELHDGVKQELFAATMHLAAARATLDATDHDAHAHLVQARRSTERAQSELAAIIEAQPPPPLHHTDLTTALTGLVDDFRHRTAIAVAMSIPPDLNASDEVAWALYRVCQEALTNIHRHADARTATVDLSAEHGRLRLEVGDDGTGIEPGSAGQGNGLVGIRERVASLDGTVDLRSTPRGTRVIVHLPSPSLERR